MMPNLFFIVPVLNEAGNLENLTRGFRSLIREFGNRYSLRFVFIDDGSTDQTVLLAKELTNGLNFTLLEHPKNLGPGKAFGTAFEYLTPHLQEQDWIVTMEGDNTSRVELLSQMFRRAEEGYEVIFASPYLYGGSIKNTSTIRIVLSSIANTFVKAFLDIEGILTVSSFFRLHRASLIKRLQTHYGTKIIEFSGFECMLEMLMKMIYINTTISEVPMVLDTKLRVGKSKMKILKTIFGYLHLWSYKSKWHEMANKSEKKISLCVGDSL
jgi:dolichol-phosphate mannosyltransferase